MNTDNILEVINLSCKRQSRLLFSDISFQLKSGELLLVEGVNGSGKSSLLRLLTGFATPFFGKIFWNNQLIHNLSTLYLENLHYIGHSNGIKLELTIAENLQLAGYYSLQKITSESVLSLFQLNAHKHTQVKYLSAGQKRRVSLAKLLLVPKILWILDEPLTALDTHTHTLFLNCLREHLKKGGMAIISSHHSIHIENVAVKTLRLCSC